MINHDGRQEHSPESQKGVMHKTNPHLRLPAEGEDIYIGALEVDLSDEHTDLMGFREAVHFAREKRRLRRQDSKAHRKANPDLFQQVSGDLHIDSARATTTKLPDPSILRLSHAIVMAQEKEGGREYDRGYLEAFSRDQENIRRFKASVWSRLLRIIPG